MKATLKQNADTAPSISTERIDVREEIAKAAGASTSFVTQVETIAANGTPEQVDLIMTKEGTVDIVNESTGRTVGEAGCSVAAQAGRTGRE